jgi:hydroxypyruvate isomerase
MELTGYLDFWFRDMPIAERVSRFAALGVRRLDVWLWRERPMADLYAECQRHGCTLNSTFDPEGGNLVDAADHPRCIDTWAESLAMAERFEIPHLFVFSNQVESRPGDGEWIAPLSRDWTPGQMYANLLDGLAKVLELVEKTDVTLWFEALNTFHIHGGVFIHSHEQAADIVRRLNHPRLRLAFDFYHQQRTAGNLIYGLEAYHGLYPTVHIADVPTRQEPGTGEINFHGIARKLRELEFDGLIGMEFYPSDTEARALRRVQEIFQLQDAKGET